MHPSSFGSALTEENKEDIFFLKKIIEIISEEHTGQLFNNFKIKRLMNLPSDYYVFLKNEIENTIKEVMEYSEAEYDFISTGNDQILRKY